MAVSSIGVQRIRPQSGTNRQRAHPTPDRSDEFDGEDGARKPPGAPPEPEPGHIIDKVA
jgi:hypothetical protein